MFGIVNYFIKPVINTRNIYNNVFLIFDKSMSGISRILTTPSEKMNPHVSLGVAHDSQEIEEEVYDVKI